jgi:hypothetical protein
MSPSSPRRPGSSGRRERRSSASSAQGNARRGGPPPPPPAGRLSDPLVGREIAGHKILERIATGRHCTIYKANQSAMARLVALKALKPQAEPAAVARFYETAKVAAQVHHANIASIYDVSSADKLHFCTMEYVEGRSVGDLLRSRQKVPSADAVRVAIDVAEALRFVAARGMPGWRLSADRVVVTPRGEVKLLPPTLVPQGAPVLGAPYVITAVGILLYGMVSGGRIPDVEAALEPGSKAAKELPPLKTVAVGARQDIALVADRLLGLGGETYPTLEAAIAALRDLLAAQEQVESRTQSATERARERAKRSNLGIILACVGGGLGLIILLGLLIASGGGKGLSERAKQDFDNANKLALASFNAYLEARKQFFNDPSDTLAKSALAHMEQAKATYEAFRAAYLDGPEKVAAARELETLDRHIGQFAAEAKLAIRDAAGIRELKKAEQEFKSDVDAKLERGGQLDLAAWQKRYGEIMTRFPNCEAIAEKLRALPRRIQREQMQVDTNEVQRRFQNEYRPARRYKDAIAAWEAYRERYDKIDFLRKNALTICEQQLIVLERDAKEQYMRMSQDAQELAKKKDAAGARKIYNEIVEKFGFPSLVESAKKRLAELPKE